MKGRKKEVKAVKGSHERKNKLFGEDKVWREKRAFFSFLFFFFLSKISLVLTPTRILQKPGFYYVSSDSGMICPKFGRILFLISIE